jgi:hypothetical protein
VLAPLLAIVIVLVSLAAQRAKLAVPLGEIEQRRRAVAARPDDSSLLCDLGEALTRAGLYPSFIALTLSPFAEQKTTAARRPEEVQ